MLFSKLNLMITQIKQHQPKCAVYFVILQIILKSPSKTKLDKKPSKGLLMLFSYNIE